MLCGIGSVLVWTCLLFTVGSAPIDSVALAAISGAIGAVGGSIGAWWQLRAAHGTSAALARAEHDANHDPLTDLYNRSGLFQELELSFQRARESETLLAVLFLDLDRFKVINDSMGHDAGDELLRIVAHRLQAGVRGTDVVARFGGDEFVVVCRELLSEKSVLAVAEQILKSFAQPVSLRGNAQVVSTSIGIAIARPGDSRTPQDLVRDADAAMYRAKKSRGGYAVFDEAQRRKVLDRLDIERDLVKALDEDQLMVYYQPIIDVAQRRLYGFEALVRWNHPTRGLISPGEFLGVAEETGMMAQIGELVMREACAQAAVWNHITPYARDIKISVNVAEQQLLDTHFPYLVSEVLAWSGLPAEQLVLEIIEDVIVDHLDGLNMLREVKALGVGLAIDDFGTGQSSLSYVKQFDMVSILKIDKSFVDDMENGTSNRAIIEAIVAMANALGMRIVAEGVENETQVRQLLGFGVPYMQGYLFNKPVRPDAIDPGVWFRPRETPTHAEAAAQEAAAAVANPALNGPLPRPARRG